MRIRHVLRAAVTAMVISAALSGCSIFGSSDSPATGADTPIELADDGSVKNSLATLTRPYQDYEVTVDVLRLTRYGKAIRAEFAITPRSNGATSRLTTSILGGSNDASGVYLLDPAGMRKYPVLESSDDDCICSSKLSGFTLDQPTLLFADFPVAPDSVKTLSLVVPEIGPLPAAEIK